ncbi:MAG: DEAD/DEAH box helicase [Gammaproteobacteria bacterium]|nr:DEAD/DEAH box helicase [Gammaproteobacteria bacterium]
MTDTHLSTTRFRDLPLAPSLIQALDELGFTQCTPIQALALPRTLAGENIVGQAQTGSGKTAAFLLSILQKLLNAPADPNYKPGSPRALVLAPTRELAVQIHRDAELLAKHSGLKLAVVFGGMDYDKQRKSLEDGIDVLIGTPGRIIDYYKQRVFTLRSIEVMVLDEADRMFDLGFIKDLRYIFRQLPPPENRLNLMFSATLSFRVNELAYEHMHNPQLVKAVSDEVTADKVEQCVYYVANDEKIPLLIGLLRQPDMERTIVFVNTKAAAEKLDDYLNLNGIVANTLSGDVPQKKRQRLVLDFQKGTFPVLVATDVAARGLHIPDVSHVVNYDLPQDAEDYVHRIGRTGRIGAEGKAISLACETYTFHLPEIEQYIGKKIPMEHVRNELLATDLKKPERRPRSHNPNGQRRGGGGRSGGQGRRQSSGPRRENKSSTS